MVRLALPQRLSSHLTARSASSTPGQSRSTSPLRSSETKHLLLKVSVIRVSIEELCDLSFMSWTPWLISMVSLGTQPCSQRSRWHERPSKHPPNEDNSNRGRLHVVQYLVVTLGDARQSTPTIFKTLNPEWNVSFEMPVVGVPLLEAICWDHDRFGKDYLGEFDIALEDDLC
jgi:C2 domain.